MDLLDGSWIYREESVSENYELSANGRLKYYPFEGGIEEIIIPEIIERCNAVWEVYN